MKVKNENFCAQPWIGLDISPQGEYKPCCKYAFSLATNLKEYLNSGQLDELKQQFVSGQKPSGCKRCWDDEQAGNLSKRLLDQKYIDTTNSQHQILSIAFGNSCNLACRICSSYSSSAWINEEAKLEKSLSVKIHSHQRFYKDSVFLEEIKTLSNTWSYIEFPGGEPFIAGVKQQLDFLDFLIDKGAQNISLHYMTNATVFPSEDFWQRWNKFKNVDIQLSIDGIENQFEYNRWPANWDLVNENMKKYSDKKTKLNNLQLSISHTVSFFTVFYLPEFILWCFKNKIQRPYLGFLDVPYCYNIKSLPKKVKKQVGNKLRKYNLIDVCNFMDSEDLSENFTDCFKHIDILDQHRQQKFSDVFPEFFQLIKEQNA